jgi:hypothetical protein
VITAPDLSLAMRWTLQVIPSINESIGSAKALEEFLQQYEQGLPYLDPRNFADYCAISFNSAVTRHAPPVPR